ncbi:MAG: protein kinase [Planctomycetes bacterium]|nr:protein kinase [Planctomycetota bacterium]
MPRSSGDDRTIPPADGRSVEPDEVTLEEALTRLQKTRYPLDEKDSTISEFVTSRLGLPPEAITLPVDDKGLFESRYDLLEVLGVGGMGIVWKVHDTLEGQDLAMKVIHPRWHSSEQMEARLIAEVRRGKKLTHPGIVRLHHVAAIEQDGARRLYFTMELLRGQTLRKRIEQGGALPLGEVAAIVDKVCEALHYAHTRSLVHRDIKPDNLFLLADGSVQILDLGIAIDLGETRMTLPQVAVGTPLYMAPEQHEGVASPAADQFSLALVVREALTGRRPHPGIDLQRSALRSIRPAVWDVLRKAASPRPKDRYGTVLAFRDAFVRAATRRSKRPLLLAALLLVAAGAGGYASYAGLLRWPPWAPGEDQPGEPSAPTPTARLAALRERVARVRADAHTADELFAPAWERIDAALAPFAGGVPDAAALDAAAARVDGALAHLPDAGAAVTALRTTVVELAGRVEQIGDPTVRDAWRRHFADTVDTRSREVLTAPAGDEDWSAADVERLTDAQVELAARAAWLTAASAVAPRLAGLWDGVGERPAAEHGGAAFDALRAELQSHRSAIADGAEPPSTATVDDLAARLGDLPKLAPLEAAAASILAAASALPAGHPQRATAGRLHERIGTALDALREPPAAPADIGTFEQGLAALLERLVPALRTTAAESGPPGAGAADALRALAVARDEQTALRQALADLDLTPPVRPDDALLRRAEALRTRVATARSDAATQDPAFAAAWQRVDRALAGVDRTAPAEAALGSAETAVTAELAGLAAASRALAELRAVATALDGATAGLPDGPVRDAWQSRFAARTGTLVSGALDAHAVGQPWSAADAERFTAARSELLAQQAWLDAARAASPRLEALAAGIGARPDAERGAAAFDALRAELDGFRTAIASGAEPAAPASLDALAARLGALPRLAALEPALRTVTGAAAALPEEHAERRAADALASAVARALDGLASPSTTPADAAPLETELGALLARLVPPLRAQAANPDATGDRAAAALRALGAARDGQPLLGAALGTLDVTPPVRPDGDLLRRSADLRARVAAARTDRRTQAPEFAPAWQRVDAALDTISRRGGLAAPTLDAAESTIGAILAHLQECATALDEFRGAAGTLAAAVEALTDDSVRTAWGRYLHQHFADGRPAYLNDDRVRAAWGPDLRTPFPDGRPAYLGDPRWALPAGAEWSAADAARFAAATASLGELQTWLTAAADASGRIAALDAQLATRPAGEHAGAAFDALQRERRELQSTIARGEEPPAAARIADLAARAARLDELAPLEPAVVCVAMAAGGLVPQHPGRVPPGELRDRTLAALDALRSPPVTELDVAGLDRELAERLPDLVAALRAQCLGGDAPRATAALQALARGRDEIPRLRAALGELDLTVPTPPRPNPTPRPPAWATVLNREPTAGDVTDAAWRDAILATGLPWRVSHRDLGIVFLLVPPDAARPAVYLQESELSTREWEVLCGQRPQRDDSPITNVSFDDVARAIARHRGMRLPTRDEWLAASNGADPGNATVNFDGRAERIPFLGRAASVSMGRFGPRGFRHMQGNVWEFLEPGARGEVEMIGGSFLDTRDKWTAVREVRQRNFKGPAIGLRLAMLPGDS